MKKERIVNIHEAKTHFSKLIQMVENGEEVLVARAGQIIAKLVPFAEAGKKRIPGTAKDQFKLKPDFDEVLNELFN